jgi:hypothetical protein
MNPKHYQIAEGIEALDVIRGALTPEQFEGYLLGNFLKYRLRLGDKDAVEQDLAKSNQYRSMLRTARGLHIPVMEVVTVGDYPSVKSPSACGSDPAKCATCVHNGSGCDG